MAKAEDELNRLYEAYRRACPDPEAGPDFMPGVWRKIEARRRFTMTLRRWTGAFVTASAALCLAMAVYMGTVVAMQQESAVLTTTYTEALDTDNYETMAYADVVSPEVFQQADYNR